VAGQAGTLEQLALAFARVLQPAARWFDDDHALDTFTDMGVAFPAAFLTDPVITPARTGARTAAAALPPLLTNLEGAIASGDDVSIIASGAALFTGCAAVVTRFQQLASAIQAAGPGLPGITAAQVSQLTANFPADLLGLLAASIIDPVPVLGPLLTVLGVLEDTYNPGDPNDPTQPEFETTTIAFDRVLPLLMSPGDYFGTLYGWGGSPPFNALPLLTALYELVSTMQLPALLGPGPVVEAYAVTIRPAAGGVVGLDFDVTMTVQLAQNTSVTLAPGWTAQVLSSGSLQPGMSGTLRPPSQLQLTSTVGAITGSASVQLTGNPAEPIVILGQAGGSRLEVAQVSLGAELTLTWDPGSGQASAVPSLTGGIQGGQLVIDASDGDGFLTTILGAGSVTSSFAIGLSFDAAAGLRFNGSGTLQIELPTHIQLGPVELQELYLIFQLAGTAVTAELSAGLSAALGPLTASVDRMGVTADITFPAGGGNAGPADITFAFKPPSGVGLSVDAGIVTGGGYLYADPASGQYAGAMQLEFADFLALGAIGLIDTKLPDGSSGFSLLVIITADFGAGIQLGFGFTLNAVGGLLGVNRAMLFQPLMDGVRTGAIDSLMFPQNIVANAPKIISDLRAIFPPQQGTFLIGPMAKLGWGEPTLVSLSLGVIVEIPPGDIAILGVLELALPAEDLAILVLQVNFAGALEFDKQRMYFFASLYDSHILFITIEGEMGLLFAWGDNANFVVTVGGFHPQYNPPPLPFPSPQRIAVDIINESYARIHADGYFAVTTNTVQFGTHSEYFFGFSAVSVTGSSGFDALIQFSPFHFSVSISTSFSANVFGVGVYGVGIDLTVEGPEPWHAHGTASLSFLFFSVGIGIDFTWGDSGNTTLAPVKVMPILTAEFGKQSNWRAMLPAGSNLLVSLRALGPSESQLVLHPVGTLQVSQRAIPLDLTLDTVGNQKPDDANRFSVSVTSPDLVQTATLTEPFAPAQFKTIDDATKLSQAAYVPQDSGIEMSAAGSRYGSGTAIVRIVRDDVTIIDTKLRRSSSKFTYYPGTLFQHGMRGNAAAKSTLSGVREQQTHPFDGSVQVSAETFAVARQSDNTVYASGAAAFASPASARDYIDRAVAADPALAGALHVLPQFEVAP
jgi:hypothetical protein